jgi:outer membrane protein TolC
MKKAIWILITLVMLPSSYGQMTNTLNLEDCIATACKNSPLNRQKQDYNQLLNYKIKNLSTDWYPAVGINAQAVYNSETTEFSDVIKMPGVSVPSMPLDQYKVWADINQQLFDGGMIKARKAVERTGSEASMEQTEADLLNVKQQVSQVYFSILITQKSSAILQVSLDELKERKKVLQAGIDHGVVLPENMMAMEVEEIKLNQSLTEMKITNDKLFKVLSILMDTTVTGNLTVAEPEGLEQPGEKMNRPEYLVFDKQKESLTASQRMITAADMPRFFAFSQAAYGRPGYDMLNQDMHAFYSVGVGMKWNFLNYGDSRRQKKMLDIQKDMLDVKRKTFDDQLNIQIESEKANIEKYNELLKQDEQILKLQKEIAAGSLAKLNHGVITSTDYLTDLDAELLSELQLENHKILSMQASYNLKLLKGN